MNMQMFRVKSTIALINAAVEAFVDNLDELLSTHCTIKDLIGNSQGAQLCDALKDFDKTRGYRHRSVLELELKGSNYIQSLMDMLWVGIHGHKTKRKKKLRRSAKKATVLSRLVMNLSQIRRLAAIPMAAFPRIIGAFLRMSKIHCHSFIKRLSFCQTPSLV